MIDYAHVLYACTLYMYQQMQRHMICPICFHHIKDFKNLGAKKVGVITDKNIARLPVMKTVAESLNKKGLSYKVFDNVRVEPTDVRYGSINVRYCATGAV